MQSRSPKKHHRKSAYFSHLWRHAADNRMVSRFLIWRILPLSLSLYACTPAAEPTLSTDTDSASSAPIRRTEIKERPVGESFESRFLSEDDERWRNSLATEDVVRIEKGHGGRSLAFKLTLADGRQGYYKPAQSFSAAHWYSEIAAYYLDRELGLGRVPPTVGRAIYWPRLRHVANGDRRIDEVEVQEDHTVRGAFIGWIDGSVPRWVLGQNWERWIRIDRELAITPYQRPRDYRGLLNSTFPFEETEVATFPEAKESPRPGRAAELSDLILFDFLTSNVDRWGGGFTNLRLQGPRGPLIFLDNGAGFWLGRNRLGLMDARLEALQRFRKTTVDALQAFDSERFRRRMQTDPLHPFLTEQQISGVEQRRLAALNHINAMYARFGTRIWLEP